MMLIMAIAWNLPQKFKLERMGNAGKASYLIFIACLRECAMFWLFILMYLMITWIVKFVDKDFEFLDTVEVFICLLALFKY